MEESLHNSEKAKVNDNLPNFSENNLKREIAHWLQTSPLEKLNNPRFEQISQFLITYSQVTNLRIDKIILKNPHIKDLKNFCIQNQLTELCQGKNFNPSRLDHSLVESENRLNFFQEQLKEEIHQYGLYVDYLENSSPERDQKSKERILLHLHNLKTRLTPHFGPSVLHYLHAMDRWNKGDRLTFIDHDFSALEPLPAEELGLELHTKLLELKAWVQLFHEISQEINLARFENLLLRRRIQQDKTLLSTIRAWLQSPNLEFYLPSEKVKQIRQKHQNWILNQNFFEKQKKDYLNMNPQSPISFLTDLFSKLTEKSLNLRTYPKRLHLVFPKKVVPDSQRLIMRQLMSGEKLSFIWNTFDRLLQSHQIPRFKLWGIENESQISNQHISSGRALMQNLFTQAIFHRVHIFEYITIGGIKNYEFRINRNRFTLNF